jgi:hypothetical protein
MNREEYLNCRTTNNIPLSLLYEYYNEKANEKKYKIFNSIEEFIQLFQLYQSQPQFHMNGFDMEKILNHFDLKFEINKMMDKDKKIIRFF